MNTRLVNCHLFDRPVPIATALLAIASQENHDGPEDDLMVRAAEYIRSLEGLVNSIDNLIDNRHNDNLARNEILSNTINPVCNLCGDYG